MPRATRTYKDHPNAFQITEIEEDSYILIGIFTRKQLETFMQGLHEGCKESATGWRGQYQALAKAIVAAYDKLEQK